MMKILKSVFILLLLVNKVSAQDAFIVKGKVVDTSLGISLENAVVTILNANDSTLVKFSRSQKDGSFSMNNFQPGEYIFMASYPEYTDFVEHIKVDSTQKSIDLGQLNMLLMSRLLQDVVVTAKNAIVINGDTIEYDASKFTIQPNSKVEDLLSQLPGMQVDKDGKITAQGEVVSKVLLDGEEFFGDDPTLVTKNIRGDMVDKVQVYDKKSDQATFTGIDDGEKTKTINIQLKEGSKNGMFGKVDVGIATDDLYQGQVMFNTFKGTSKFAAYGTLGNTGTVGLNWQDSEKYGGSGNVQFSDGMIFITSGGSDELDSFSGEYNGQGIPLARSGGLHYDTKWNDKKESINANYKIGSLEVDGVRNTFTQNNLPNGMIESNAQQEFNNFMFRQKLDTRYEVNFDSTSTLKVSLEGALKNTRSDNSNLSSSENEEGFLLNQSKRNSSSEGDNRNFSADVLWNKKLKKKGRTLSINLKQSFSNDENEGFLNSENSFYGDQGVLDSMQTIDQRKTNSTESTILTTNVAYTEPLSKTLSLAVNYRMNYNQGKSDRMSYNQGLNGEYTSLDSLYSNAFDLNQLSNQVGTTLNYNAEKNKINVTFSAADVKFKQIDRFHDETIKRSFINLNPNARWTHQFSSQESFSLNYYGSTRQPSLTQIQPMRENQDPLNIVIGNPDLDPSFNHSLRASYYGYKVLTGRYVNLSASGSFTSNGIVTNIMTDEVGKSVYKYENLSNERPINLSTFLNYGNKIKSLNLNYGFAIDGSTSSYFNMINNELNKTVSNRVGLGLNINKNVQKKYSFYIRTGPNYTSSDASLQTQVSNEGWGYSANGSASVYLPGKLEVFTDVDYTYTQATQTFDENFERLIWDGGLRKKFLKSDELIVTLRVNDLLNQNKGFDRSSYNNMNTQTSYTTIKRYFMFSLTWDFNKMGGGN